MGAEDVIERETKIGKPEAPRAVLKTKREEAHGEDARRAGRGPEKRETKGAAVTPALGQKAGRTTQDATVAREAS